MIGKNRIVVNFVVNFAFKRRFLRFKNGHSALKTDSGETAQSIDK